MHFHCADTSMGPVPAEVLYECHTGTLANGCSGCAQAKQLHLQANVHKDISSMVRSTSCRTKADCSKSDARARRHIGHSACMDPSTNRRQHSSRRRPHAHHRRANPPMPCARRLSLSCTAPTCPCRWFGITHADKGVSPSTSTSAATLLRQLPPRQARFGLPL